MKRFKGTIEVNFEGEMTLSQANNIVRILANHLEGGETPRINIDVHEAWEIKGGK